MKLRTWHFESAIVGVVLVVTTLAWQRGAALPERLLAGDLRGAAMAATPWGAALARWLSFGAMSIGNRVAERAELRARWATRAGVPENAHEVYCAHLLVWLVVVGQLVAGAAQAAAGAWDGLVLGLLFALYVPVWRKRIWRRLYPLQDGPVATVDGVPAAQPLRPAVPSDVGGTFYLLLGYVYIPGGWNPTQAIQRQWIHECAEVPALNSTLGVTPSRPANQLWKPSGSVDKNEGGQSSAFRPSTYLPSTAIGGEEIWIPIDFARNTILDGDIVDDGCDWRYRLCEWSVYFRAGGGDDNRFAFDRKATGNTPALSAIAGIVNNEPYFNAHGGTLSYGVGQTFRDDTGAVKGFAPAMADGHGIAMYVDGMMLTQMNVGGPDAGNAFFLYCDTTGALRLKRKGTLPGRCSCGCVPRRPMRTLRCRYSG